MTMTKNPPTPRTIPLLLAAFLISLPAQAQYGGGTGEPNDPWLIYTPAQMNAIGADPNHWDKQFKLMADIDLSGYRGEQFNIIGRGYDSGSTLKPFAGVFDGNDHTISNFTWDSTCRDYVGLFGYVEGLAAEVRNVHIIDPNVAAEGSRGIGSLVGCLASGVITNCSVHGGSISGMYSVGGLVGAAEGPVPRSRTTPDQPPLPGGMITDCHTNIAVVGTSDVGGLVGTNRGTITDCQTDADVSGNSAIGGLVGQNNRTIARCYATGSTAGYSGVGNLVGSNWWHGTITDCYSTGTVSGVGNVGGLLGAHMGAIENCYSNSEVTGDTFVGGLVGGSISPADTVTQCHAGGRVAGTSYVGGLMGSNAGIITNCYATGDVIGDDRLSIYLGGLVGSNSESIANSCSTGAVRGAQNVGGLAGENRRTITNCYSTGLVWGVQDVGGFVGINDGAITNCYAVGLTVGSERLGGLVASAKASHYRPATTTASFWDIQTTRQLTSAGGTGKSTFKIQAADTFLSAGWDFVGETANGTDDIWWVEEGRDYPRLWWEAPGE